MPALVLELRKHLFIYLLLVKNSLIAQMEFRSNFFVAIGLEVVFVIVRLAYLLVIYQNGIVLVGIPPSGMLLFLGSFYLVTGLFNGLFLGNIFDIPDYVGAGTLVDDQADLAAVLPYAETGQFREPLAHVSWRCGDGYHWVAPFAYPFHGRQSHDVHRVFGRGSNDVIRNLPRGISALILDCKGGIPICFLR